MANQKRFIKLFLRISGSVSFLAVFAVVMPYSWMDAVHQWLGMGKLPDEPIVGYLAWSTSAFYALLGGLLWTVSFHLHRNRLVLRYLGAAIIFLGIALFVVDSVEGMPLFWKICEGPVNVIFGIIVLWCSHRIKQISSGKDRADVETNQE
jgi:cytochrome c oxidase subunit IV